MAPPSGISSLKEVARVAGVSQATVSRILNNRYEGFSARPEVRQRVLKAAQSLSYRPHLMAQSLRKTSMGIIGLLGLELTPVLPDPLVRGMVEVLEAHQLKLSAYFAPSIHDAHQLPPWRIDGAMVISTLSPADIQPLEKASIPYVSVNGWRGANGSLVNYDDAGGVSLALRHLLDLGHRRIAYANARGPLMPHPSVKLRHDAYLRVLGEAGLAPMPGHDQPFPEQPAGFLRRLVDDHGATAILAYQHYYALDILAAAREMGLEIPRQLSLVCFNDEKIVEVTAPPLTVIHLPTDQAGRIAAEALVAMLKRPRGKRSETVLPETLVVRASTAPPPRA